MSTNLIPILYLIGLMLLYGAIGYGMWKKDKFKEVGPIMLFIFLLPYPILLPILLMLSEKEE